MLRHRARLVYTMAVANPTGGVMSDQRGEELNNICKVHNVPLFVDYAYYGLTFSNLSNPPRIPYPDDNVLLGFSASKLGFPGAGVGYMAIQNEEIYRKIKDRKQATEIMSSSIAELLIWKVATSEDFTNRVKRAAMEYEERAKSGMSALEKNNDIFSVERPYGGMFLWVKVNNGVSTLRACDVFYKNNILHTPLESCRSQGNFCCQMEHLSENH